MNNTMENSECSSVHSEKAPESLQADAQSLKRKRSRNDVELEYEFLGKSIVSMFFKL